MTLTEVQLSDGQRVTLRPESAGDEPLLFALFASTRAEELALSDWDEGTRRQLLETQFRAQRAGFRSRFPQAEFAIVMLGGTAFGRMVWHRTPDEVRLVDVVIAPEARGRGIGTALTQAVLAEAARSNQPVRLHVLRHNRAAGLYQRLGFRKVAEHGLHDEMEWRPPATNP